MAKAATNEADLIKQLYQIKKERLEKTKEFLDGAEVQAVLDRLTADHENYITADPASLEVNVRGQLESTINTLQNIRAQVNQGLSTINSILGE